MDKMRFDEMLEYLGLLLPQMAARRLDGACFVRLRVGEFDNYTSQWGIQLRFPKLERKKVKGSRHSIYQAGTQRLFCWNGQLGNPSDDFLSKQRIYGKGVLPYFLNASEGMSHEADRAFPQLNQMLGLNSWLISTCQQLDQLELDRLYLSHFASEPLGVGDFFVARKLDGEPSQFPSAHNGSLFQVGAMVIENESKWAPLGQSEVEVNHIVAMNGLIKKLKPSYPGQHDLLKLLRGQAVRRVRGAGGYGHC